MVPQFTHPTYFRDVEPVNAEITGSAIFTVSVSARYPSLHIRPGRAVAPHGLRLMLAISRTRSNPALPDAHLPYPAGALLQLSENRGTAVVAITGCAALRSRLARCTRQSVMPYLATASVLGSHGVTSLNAKLVQTAGARRSGR